jgi:pyridoxine 5-phosphate synthase
VTLVPDDPAQATSDHGWDFAAGRGFLEPVVKRLKRAGMRVSLFANPDPAGMDIARSLGADRVELYTGPYGSAHDDPAKAAGQLALLGKAADVAIAQGLDVNAGHDLTVANLPALARRIPDLAEVSIGHAVTAEALEFGMAETVRRFLQACGW